MKTRFFIYFTKFSGNHKNIIVNADVYNVVFTFVKL